MGLSSIMLYKFLNFFFFLYVRFPLTCVNLTEEILDEDALVVVRQRIGRVDVRVARDIEGVEISLARGDLGDLLAHLAL
jgi:hypothetical protein